MIKGERKFTRVYEDEFEKTTWTYDLDYFPSGPISVDIKTKIDLYKKNKNTDGKKVKNSGRADNVSVENNTPRTRHTRQKRS